MKLSEQWLREWVSPPLDTEALAERLTLAGFEVAAIEPAGPALERVVAGRILDVEPHPAAERLKVCRVDAGGRSALTVVCGAPNAAVGLVAPLALPGARLAGAEVAVRAVRGIHSEAALCSAAELGLEDSAEGLLPFDPETAPGTPAHKCLELDDRVLDIDITPNRGDCLSAGGLAREIAALTGVPVTPPSMPEVPAAHGRRLPVRLHAAQDCPRYVGRVLTGVNPNAQTPLWLRERLRRSGLRSLGPVVDVTNYVMLELGQPMHAFDLARLTGEVRVRRAGSGERLILLDGREVAVPPGTLLIADAERPVAVAGIMGGQDSAVGPETQDIFLESAYFRPQAVAGRARELGLQTESSYRFERGVDPALQRLAMERATALLLTITGGRPGPVIEVRAPAHLPKRPPLRLRRAQLRRLLGADIPGNEVEGILMRLGLRPRRVAGGWRVRPPSHRFDIERECDLIEEAARLHGYARLPECTPQAPVAAVPQPEGRISERRLREVLVDRDYREVITYSFVDPQLQRKLVPGMPALRLANPISNDMTVLRTSLWPGLIAAVRHNLNRQHRRVRLFELGTVFRPDGRTPVEEGRLAGAITGPAWPLQWGAPERAVDFYDLKGDVEALLGPAAQGFEFQPLDDPALHPGQAAAIYRGRRRIGRLGALHPAFQEALDLPQAVFLFELELETLQNSVVPRYNPISRYPAIRRDLSVVVDKGIHARQVLETASRAAGGVLRKLELFDLYRGEDIDSRRKSLAFRLTLQDSSRTLRDDDVERIMVKIVAALKSELGAELR